MANPPSGEQHTLARGDLCAVVTEIGATLRHLSAGEQQLIWGFGADELCSGGRGQVLAPWPNRLDEGRYRFGSHEAHAALDEAQRNCAIHGLVRWLPWRVESRTKETVQLALTLHPSPAYPFRLGLELSYELTDDGLRVEASASSEGDEPVPFGIGFHPYLDPGPGGVDAAQLEIPAARRVALDGRGMPMGPPADVTAADPVSVVARLRNERRNGGQTRPTAGATPSGVAPSGSPAEAPVVGAARLDECLTGLQPDEDGRWRARLYPGQGRDGLQPAGIELWAEHDPFGYCELFTADTLPGAGLRRAIAVEPMTCPPNAFRSGTDVIVLEPGSAFLGRFGIRTLR